MRGQLPSHAAIDLLQPQSGANQLQEIQAVQNQHDQQRQDDGELHDRPTALQSRVTARPALSG